MITREGPKRLITCSCGRMRMACAAALRGRSSRCRTRSLASAANSSPQTPHATSAASCATALAGNVPPVLPLPAVIAAAALPRGAASLLPRPAAGDLPLASAPSTAASPPAAPFAVRGRRGICRGEAAGLAAASRLMRAGGAGLVASCRCCSGEPPGLPLASGSGSGSDVA